MKYILGNNPLAFQGFKAPLGKRCTINLVFIPRKEPLLTQSCVLQEAVLFNSVQEYFLLNRKIRSYDGKCFKI